MDSTDPNWIKYSDDLKIGDGYHFDTKKITHAIIEDINEDSLDFTRGWKAKASFSAEQRIECDSHSSDSDMKLKAGANFSPPPHGLSMDLGFKSDTKKSEKNGTESKDTTFCVSVLLQTGTQRLKNIKSARVRQILEPKPTHYVSSLAYGGYLIMHITAKMESYDKKMEFVRCIGANSEISIEHNGLNANGENEVKRIQDSLSTATIHVNDIKHSVPGTPFVHPQNSTNGEIDFQRIFDLFIEQVEQQNHNRGMPMHAHIAPLCELDHSVEPYVIDTRLENKMHDLEYMYKDINSALHKLRSITDNEHKLDEHPQHLIDLEIELVSLRDSFAKEKKGLTHRDTDYDKNVEILEDLENAYRKFNPKDGGRTRCVRKVNRLTQDYVQDTHPHKMLPPSPVKGRHTNIVIVGRVGVGKSSTGNMIVGKGIFQAGGSRMKGVTQDLTLHCAIVGGRKLRLMDTPGIMEAMSNDDTLLVEKKLTKCISMLEGEDIDAFLFVMRCDEKPSEVEKSAVTKLVTFFSKDLFEYMIIVITHEDKLSTNATSTESFVKNLPRQMQIILKKAGNRIVFINAVTPDATQRIKQVECIISHVDEIARTHEGKKFTHSAIKKARIERDKLKQQKPRMSDIDIQNTLEKRIAEDLRGKCFAACSTVRLNDGSFTSMAKLSPGDKVLCLKGDGSVGFEEIFCFSHADENCQSIYVHLETATGQRLLLSYGHYIHARSNSASFPFPLKAARDIGVGDEVFVYHPATNAMFMDEIVSKGTKEVTGAFCPHTTSGTIIVNDILASCYTDAVDPQMARKLLMPAWCLNKLLPLRVSAPVLKDGVSNTCKMLSATKQYLKSLY